MRDDGQPLRGKPEFFGPHHASTFQDQNVVAAYTLRPPYPEAIFDLLANLIVDEPRTVLDLGCGTGAIARGLLNAVKRVDALDVSAPMIESGRRLPGGSRPNLHWILGRSEDARLNPPYALITSAASMPWMNWDVVLPRLSDVLTERGVLALVDNRMEPPAWDADIIQIFQRYTTNPTRDHEYDWIQEIVRRGLFRPLGDAKTEKVTFRQPLDAYVESFHSRSSFSRERMGPERAAAFDVAIRDLVGAHRTSDVELHIYAQITWGRPLRPA
jgi:SAM-dependent methyltransferase